MRRGSPAKSEALQILSPGYLGWHDRRCPSYTIRDLRDTMRKALVVGGSVVTVVVALAALIVIQGYLTAPAVVRQANPHPVPLELAALTTG